VFSVLKALFTQKGQREDTKDRKKPPQADAIFVNISEPIFVFTSYNPAGPEFSGLELSSIRS
jgi:hypothetical protein